MDKLVFIGLSFIYTVLGILSITRGFKKMALKFFIFLCIALPIVNFTQAYHFKSQVSVYNFFFIGVYIYYAAKVVYQFRLSRRIIGGILLTAVFLLAYIAHLFLIVNETREVINVLKDVKPFITIITAYLFIDYFRDELEELLNDTFVFRLLLINCLVSTAFYVLMVKYNVNVILSGDAYYKYNELRYLSLGTYFGIFYLLFNAVKGNFPQISNLILAVIPLFFTGNRTLLVTFFVTLVISVVIKQSVQRIIAFFASGSFALAIMIVLIRFSEETSALYRFKELTDIKYIMKALANRISPYTNELSTMNFHEFVIGKGLGFAFFIPWFEYRENIEDYNIYLDNLYLTLLAKYGLFALAFFIIINDYLRNYLVSKTQRLVYMLFFLLLAFTNAVFYQYYFLWFLIMLVLPFSLKTKKEKVLS